MGPIEALAATYGGWTDDAMRAEMASMREKRKSGAYDAATERNALDMLRDMATVLDYREDPTSDAPECSHEWEAVCECGVCGYAQQYVSVEAVPDNCAGCGEPWLD